MKRRKKPSSAEEKIKKGFSVVREGEGKDDTDYSNFTNKGYGGWANLFVF